MAGELAIGKAVIINDQVGDIVNIRVDCNGEPLITVKLLSDEGEYVLYSARFCEVKLYKGER